MMGSTGLVRWNILCQLREGAGVGIHDLNIKNVTLLSKQLFKLLRVLIYKA